MKILSVKKNSTGSIRGWENSKKTKQSVKRVTKILQTIGASEKVRKSTTQAKAEQLPRSQVAAKNIPIK